MTEARLSWKEEEYSTFSIHNCYSLLKPLLYNKLDFGRIKKKVHDPMFFIQSFDIKFFSADYIAINLISVTSGDMGLYLVCYQPLLTLMPFSSQKSRF